MANEYLKRTTTSTGNRKVFTWSGWVKQNNPNTNLNGIFAFEEPSASAHYIGISGNAPYWRDGAIASQTWESSTLKLRDLSSWSHFMFVMDTTLSVDLDRAKVYVNGILQSQTNNSTNLSINEETFFNRSGFNSYIGNVIAGTSYTGEFLFTDIFYIDGQALTPDVFGYYKKGDGYISAGTTQATDFKRGQWVPKAPKVIKSVINARGGFGVNGFYLPMNDDSNFGADFHCKPNSIIKLKGEEDPQPRNGAPTTTDAYVSQLRDDPYKDYLVLAIPGIKGGRQSGYGDYSADIKGSGTNKVMTAVGGAGVTDAPSFYGSAISIAGSGDPVSYIETQASPDFDFNSDDFTVEFWEYRDTANNTPIILDSNVTVYAPLIAYTAGSNIVFYATDDDSAGSAWDIANNVSFGPSLAGQWNHIALCRKGTQFYLLYNGVVTNTFTSSKSIYQFANKITIGRAQNQATFDGKIQDLRVYKGVAKYTSGFDIVKPYTPVGIETWRTVPDTTTNNFATLNPLTQLDNGSITYTNGNLTGYVSANTNSTVSTIGISSLSSRKYYAEFRATNNLYPRIGVIDATVAQQGISGSGSGAASANNLNTSGAISWGGIGNELYINSSTPSYSAASYTNGDIIGVAYDSSTRNVWFSKNGTWQNFTGSGADPETGTNPVGSLNGSDSVYFGIRPENSNIDCNFGQNPTFSGNTTAGTYTDSNGKGLFKYQPPAGFLALCEDNLPTPAIKNPGEYFKTVLWTGDGNSGRSIVGVGFTPDLVWVKNRTGTQWHILTDSVRGPVRNLFSNATNAEVSPDTAGYINSFSSDGFSVQTGSVDISNFNSSGNNYVAWCWRAGAGTTSINTDGSIDSVVSVNQDAGFSIVSYNGATGTPSVGHGLNKVPKFIIVKNRDFTSGWFTYHVGFGATKFIRLNSTEVATTNSTIWNDTTPTSSVFYLGGDSGVSSRTTDRYIAYCWAEIEGFSKFGSYVGNLNADGPFVYCGFKPAWVLIKRTDTTGSWGIWNSSVDSTNPSFRYLLPNDPGLEQTGTTHSLDFLSNGFKIRNDQTFTNASGGTYIFAAFAESPFTTANAK